MKSVRISYGASWSYLEAPEGQYPSLIRCVRDGLSVPMEGAFFAPSYQSGKWDGNIHFMTLGGKFASGLIPRVQEILRAVGYEAEVRNLPEPVDPPKEPPKLHGLPELVEESPWWFQWTAVQACLKGGRGVLKSPTGSGKTQMAAMLAKVLCTERVLFLVDRIDLLDQTADRFESLLQEPIARIGGGDHRVSPSVRICVATVQTLAEKKDKKTKVVLSPLWTKNTSLPRAWLSGVTLLFLDECHLATTDSFFNVTQAFTAANHRFGLSATPFDRGDLNTTKLLACCGEELYSIPARVLIDLGILAEPNIVMVDYQNVSDVAYERNSRTSYEEVYDRYVHSNPARNKAILDIVRGRTNVLVLVRKKANHGERLYQMLREALPEQSVAYVSGDSTRRSRKEKRADFLGGKMDILIATSIYDKGVDLPNVSTLVLAEGGKNVAGTIQKLGRGMRGAVKDRVDVFDFYDLACPALVEHTLSRYDTYSGEGYTVRVLTPEEALHS